MASVDPIEAALSNGTNSAQATDPIEAALMGQKARPVALPNIPSPAPTPGNPVIDPLFWQSMGLNAVDMGRAFAHHAMNIGHGGAQFLENLNAGSALAAQGRFANQLGANRAADVAMQDEAAMRQREANYQATVPNNAATYTGAVAGEIAPFLLSGGLQQALTKTGEAVAQPFNAAAQKIPQVGSLLRLGGKTAAGAAQGALISLPTPVVGTDQSYGAQKAGQIGTGAVVGGTVPLATGIIGGTYRGVRNFVAPLVAPQSVVSGALQKFAGPNAQDMADQLRNAPQLVPGSEPTSAQVLQSPEIVQAEKTIAGNPRYKPMFMAQQNAANAARLSAVGNVAQTPEALQAAVAERSAATQPLIDKFLTNGNAVPVAQVQDALDQLRQGSLSTDPVVKKAIGSVSKELEDRIAKDGTIQPAVLDGIRQNVRRFLQENASNGVVSSKQEAAFVPVRNAITDAIESANPGYKEYLKLFAQKSVPINTMEAGQQLQDILSQRALDASGNPIVNMAGYRTALNKATSGPYGISPEAQASLDAVQKDLQRATISNAVRVPGSDTAFNLRAPGWLGLHFYGQDFTGPTTPAKIVGGLLGGGVTGHPILGAAAGYATAEKVGQFAGNRVNDVMAKALIDRHLMADLLAARQSGDLALASRIEGLLASRGTPALAYTAARQQATPRGLLGIQPTAP